MSMPPPRSTATLPVPVLVLVLRPPAPAIVPQQLHRLPRRQELLGATREELGTLHLRRARGPPPQHEAFLPVRLGADGGGGGGAGG
jgi:hypothetical protein